MEGEGGFSWSFTMGCSAEKISSTDWMERYLWISQRFISGNFQGCSSDSVLFTPFPKQLPCLRCFFMNCCCFDLVAFPVHLRLGFFNYFLSLVINFMYFWRQRRNRAFEILYWWKHYRNLRFMLLLFMCRNICQENL